nr:unnamed protein product [Callosobruchus analis]
MKRKRHLGLEYETDSGSRVLNPKILKEPCGDNCKLVKKEFLKKVGKLHTPIFGAHQKHISQQTVDTAVKKEKERRYCNA